MSDDDELSEEPACTQTTEETTYERLVAERKKAFAEANSADQLAKLRATGKEQFNSRDYPGAIQTYTDALALLGGAPTTDAAKKARKTLLLNRAVGHLKLRNFPEAEADCTAVIKLDPANSKARYNRAKARRFVGKLFDAYDDLVVAAKKVKKHPRDGRSLDPKCIYQAQMDLLLECGTGLAPNPDGMGIPLCKSFKEIVHPGAGHGDETAHHVARGDVVTTHAVGRLKDTKQVFWTTRREGNSPKTFTAGREEVIKGWDRGVMNMVVGEVRRLQIPPEDGYGADGSPQLGIPPHSTLLLEIELLEAKPKPPLRVAMVGWLGGWKMIILACVVLVIAVLWQADLQTVSLQ